VTRIAQTEVTREAVLDHLRSEQFDVIHYAGHAFFEPGAPGDSGILCADGALRALDLLNLRSLPPLLFFNACEAGRLRRGPGLKRTRVPDDARRALGTAVGLAEAFMRYGVANFVGTYWPVQDASASTFARAFYALLLAGATIGDALLAGRKAVQARGSVDWADYIHYGDARFRVKDSVG
jgi:CHAT domain-containing protein